MENYKRKENQQEFHDTQRKLIQSLRNILSYKSFNYFLFLLYAKNKRCLIRFKSLNQKVKKDSQKKVRSLMRFRKQIYSIKKSNQEKLIIREEINKIRKRIECLINYEKELKNLQKKKLIIRLKLFNQNNRQLKKNWEYLLDQEQLKANITKLEQDI
ncbi:unnamed protein product [Paramecium pentaurelia]|uniref:Uncharacterized protein n=1 Tax=Paramecium pentaurelia TaxID=43138 RepID=A0A8S1ULJ5_9CILI|nr:unnamed protein product [Paramecium pentaurelia]